MTYTMGVLVKVISGFYIGCTGVVIDYYKWDNYLVELTCTNGAVTRSVTVRLDAKELVKDGDK